MCLKRLVEKDEPRHKYPRDEDGNGIGWKVFSRRSRWSGMLTGTHRSQDYIRPLRQWLDERDFREDGDKDRNMLKFRKFVIYDPIQCYPTGWHICLDKDEAQEWCIPGQDFVYQVKFRKVVRHGWGSIRKIDPQVIAKEIYIVPTTGKERV